MKKRFLFPAIISLLFAILLVPGCKRDDSEDPIVEDNDTLSALDFQINDFIWTGLSMYYLWVDEVPNLSASNFSSEANWKSFLNKYPDHEDFFYSLLYDYNKVDKFSWIVDDYVALEQQFQGISKSMGYEFRFGRYSDSDNLFGVVIYVLPGTPAAAAGMKRGDIFIKVNGMEITESNYEDLLFSSDTYTLSFASISGNSLVPNGKNATMTAVEIHENPILLDTIYNISSKNVGYLVYNGFMSDYDVELNNVFANFKSNNVKELILDLRYNSGGYVSSAVYLASMIYSKDTNKVFITEKYNDAFQEFIDETYGVDFSIINFSDKIFSEADSSETPITSLGLSKLYILTTNNSASASELIISGLKPYMNLITIGTTTYGKYVGSMTIYDYLNNGDINPAHTWAMQPIIMKSVNSVGESDYVDGFAPNYEVNEEIATMYPFGNTADPLLQKAISHISGTLKTTREVTDLKFQFVPFGFSKDSKPFSKEMIVRNKFQKKSTQQLKESRLKK